jgi:cation/acetate symporter
MNGAGAREAIVFFVLFVASTLAITWWAARRTRSAGAFFAAGHSVTTLQNGLALAGDFVAASAFLGVTGIAALSGFNAIVFAVAMTVAWPFMLFLFAEPLRALGKYTFADVIEYRLSNPRIKAWTALVTIASVFTILTFQMAGAGAVIKLLFGVSYALSVALIGGFMLIYVLFGGMIATTWVQIIKMALLLAITLLLTGMVLANYGWSPDAVLGAAARRAGAQVLGPGAGMSPLELFALGFASTIGVTSLPQVLLRFYTVPNPAVARRSLLVASVVIGLSVLMFVFLGYGVMAVLGPDVVRAADRGGNMAVPLLAEHFGGPILLGFVGAVCFATILAAVCGILLAGSAALAHDFWTGVVRRGKADDAEELLVARVSTALLCVGGVALAILVEGQNIFVLSAISATIAASTIFPALILSIYWRGLTYAGTVAGLVAGLTAGLLCLYMGPLVQVQMLGRPAAMLNLGAPAILTCPLAFFVMWLGSILSPAGATDERYEDISARSGSGWAPREEGSTA